MFHILPALHLGSSAPGKMLEWQSVGILQVQ